MTPNVGTIDRVLRTALGFALLYLAFFSGWPLFDKMLYQIGAVAIALVMFTVASLRVCPIYSIAGIRTNQG